MKIELAEHYGFCYGVERAIEIAEKHPNSVTFGPLIHNKDEIKRLKDDYNVGLVDSYEEAKDYDTIIVRTHGITKDGYKQLKKDGKKIINATCPFVTKPQQIVEEMCKEDYTIVIFGDANHPEIKGVASFGEEGRVFTVLSEDEIVGLPLGPKVATVAQTTRKPQEFQKIVGALSVRVAELRVFNTICNATFENQDATRELANKSDVMIIIGGKNSSNNKQLYSISKTICEDSYHIENESEINPAWFGGKTHCGISAGASTPDWIIQKVIKRVEEITN